MPDFIVEGTVIVEVKAIEALHDLHTAVCLSYLAAAKMPVCLLINFAKRVQIKRLVGSAMKHNGHCCL